LNDNNITDIHPSTFHTNSKLTGLHISGNKLTSIKPGTFDNNRELRWLNLEGNSISEVNRSTFRNNNRLRHLDISRNQINLINPETFIHNRELTFLYLQGNNITEISKTLFGGLEQLEELDLFNNNIEELNPLVFHNTFTITNRQNHQESKLKHLNLAENYIRSFNFELYFPVYSNFDSSNRTFPLEYLNLSSNRLTMLDVASVQWLNQTTAVIDLTANPWNCDCSVLLEVWRGLKHKLTLHCASPRRLQGMSWDWIENFCSILAQEKPINVGWPSVSTTSLFVIGILLFCVIGGGLILRKLVNRLKSIYLVFIP
jgi:Leucine-rich repeat (LRR) protein